MTDNDKRYEDFVLELRELCKKHGLSLGVDDKAEMAVWRSECSDIDAVDYIENRLD